MSSLKFFHFNHCVHFGHCFHFYKCSETYKKNCKFQNFQYWQTFLVSFKIIVKTLLAVENGLRTLSRILAVMSEFWDHSYESKCFVCSVQYYTSNMWFEKSYLCSYLKKIHESNGVPLRKNQSCYFADSAVQGFALSFIDNSVFQGQRLWRRLPDSQLGGYPQLPLIRLFELVFWVNIVSAAQLY